MTVPFRAGDILTEFDCGAATSRRGTGKRHLATLQGSVIVVQLEDTELDIFGLVNFIGDRGDSRFTDQVLGA